MSEFEKQLCELINRNCKENDSNTPDFILACYLEYCLMAFNVATNQRDKWHGFNSNIGKGLTAQGGER